MLETRKGIEILKIYLQKNMESRAFDLAVHGHDPKQDEVLKGYLANIRRDQYDRVKKWQPPKK